MIEIIGIAILLWGFGRAMSIIQTVIKRELADLAFVSALVAIRTAISFLLGRELAEVRGESRAPAA